MTSPFLARAALCALTASPAWAQDAKTAPTAPFEPTPLARVANDPARVPAIDANASSARTRLAAPARPALDAHGALPGLLWSAREDALWVRADGYKARFAGAGFTFVPFLGSDAPQDEPVEFALASARVAGAELECVAANVRRAGDRVELDRGAFVERYDVREDGVEQSFVFDRLATRGAIELDLAVSTRLAHSADATGHHFGCERGAVHYGAATAIDARGRALSLETTFDGGALHLVVPAAFVAQAELPLVVDPLVTSTSLDSSTADTIHPDLAYDVASGRWAAAIEIAFSGSDHDLVVDFFDDTGYSTQRTVIDTSIVNWATPRIANCTSGGQFLVVAAVGLLGTREIHGTRLSAATGFILGDVRLDTAAGDKLDPDVGGDPSSGPVGTFAVVWTRVFSTTDRDVHGRFLYTDGTLSGPGEMLLDNSGGTLDERPRIANSCGLGANPTWMIVFQRATTVVNHDILGLGLARTGSVVFPTYAIDNGPSDSTAPVISPATDEVNGTSYRLCAYVEPVPGHHNDVLGRFLDENVVIDTYSLGFDDDDEIEPDVDTDGRVFTLAYERERIVNTGTYGTLYKSVAFVPSSARETELAVAGTATAVEGVPHVYAKRSAGGPTGSAGLVYQRTFSATDREVDFSLFDVDFTPLPMTFCTGDAPLCPCGNGGALGHGCANSVNPNGALLTAAGNSVVSADTLQLVVSGVPATAPCLFFQGDYANGATTFGDGLLCAGGTVVRLRTRAASAGSTAYPIAGDSSLSVRGALPPEGGVRVYQAWYRNAAAFCTSATFNTTNAVLAWWMP